jgi:hypothetical protein
MLRVLSGIFITLHGLVHLWYVVLSQEWIEFEPDMGWTSQSWLLSGLLEETVTRSLAGVIFMLATVAFVVSGIGIFAQADWWRTALLSSAIFSSASVLLYWDGSLEMIVEKGLIALLINVGIIIVLFLIEKK